MTCLYPYWEPMNRKKVSALADKKHGKKPQFILFGIISIIALAVCAAVLIITVRSIDTGNSSAEPDAQSKTELTNDTQTLLDYLGKVTAYSAVNRFIKADIYTDSYVDDNTLTVTDGNGTALDSDRNLLIYAKNKLLPTVDTYYPEDEKGVFGKVNSSLRKVDLTANDVESVTFSVGETDAEGNPVYDADTGELVNSEYYFITVRLKIAPNDYSAKRVELFCNDIADSCSVNKSDVDLTESIICAKVNRFTDKLETLTFDKTYSIKADVTFKGKLAVFSDRQVGFTYRTSERYEYSYAGINFAEDTATVKPGDEIMLSVNAVIENDSEYTVTFFSSDTTVATVDEMGYVKGITASDKPVTIKVVLVYLGEVFFDECTVYVSDSQKK